MADFGNNFDQSEIDPAAEFLAREQNELAGLEDEVKPAAISVQPVVNGNGGPTLSVNKENSYSSFEMVDGLDQDGLNTLKEEINDGLDVDREYLRGVSPSPPPSKNEMREEPEKIRKWREEQIERLEQKDKEEEKKKQEWQEIAKVELEEWYKNHEEIIAKTKAANRDAAKNAEKQFVAEDNEIEPGTEWERIAKLCDFNPKAKQGSKDVSRMRSIILQLKQTPLSANKA